MKQLSLNLNQFLYKIDKEFDLLLHSQFNSKRSLRPIIEILYEKFKENPEGYLTAAQLLKHANVGKKKITETAQIYVTVRINSQILNGYEGESGISFYIEKNGNTYRLRVSYKGQNFLKLGSKLADSTFPDYSIEYETQIAPKIDSYIDAIIAKLFDRYSEKYIPTDVRDKNVLDDFDIETDPCKITEAFKASYKKKIDKKASVIESLTKYSKDHVLLVGKPGSGKTTALHKFLLLQAQKVKHDKGLPIPILLSLKYFRSSIIDLVVKTLNDFWQLNISNEEAEYLINAKRFIYLFDGINEAPSQDSLDSLSELIDENSDVPMVFTTREFSKGEGLTIKKRLEMLPLKDPQISQYAKNLLQNRYKDFLHKLEPRQKELAEIPLFLTMLISIYDFDMESATPTNLGEAFREYTKLLVTSSKEGINVTEDEKKRWQTIIQYIAFRMMEGPDRKNVFLVVDGKEAVEIISDMNFGDISKSIQILKNIIDHHLIISHADGKIEFSHQMIQEYFAAEYLLEYLPKLKDYEIKHQFLNYTKWTEPIVMMLGFCDDRDFIERIINLSIDIDRMLTARLAGAIKSQYRKRVIKRIMPLYSSDHLKVEAFKHIGGQEAIDFMFPLIEMEDMPYYFNMILFLGKHERTKIIEHLITSIKSRNKNLEACRNSIVILAMMGAHEAIKSIRECLLVSPPPLDIFLAAKALGAIEEIDPFEWYIMPFLEGQYATLEHMMISMLPFIKSPKVVEYLIERLLKKENALNEEDSLLIKFATIKALVKIGDKRAVNPLISLLRNHQEKDIDENLIFAIIPALGHLKDQKAIDSLNLILENENIILRQIALTAILRIRKTISTKELSFLDGIVEEVTPSMDLVIPSDSLAGALGEIGTPEAVEYLLRMLINTKNHYEGCKKSLIMLRDIIDDPTFDLSLRKELAAVKRSLLKKYGEILIALSKTNDNRAVDAVIEYSQSAEFRTENPGFYRSTIIQVLEALGEVKAIRAVEYIRQFLNEKEDPYILLSAAKALLAMGEKIPDDLIVSLHRHEKCYSLNQSIWILFKKYGDEETILKLKDCPDTLSGWHLKQILPIIQSKCMIYNPSLK